QVVATLGLGSIALGFAFKDIIENFLAGIIILWKFPYDAGDFIECEGITGRVENIELRMTLIRRTDGVLDLIPNAMMFKNPVKVLTNRPIRRMTVMCGVAYGEDVAESRKVIKQAVEACTSIDKSNPVEIFAQEFGASSIDFEVTWWCGSTPLQVRESRDEVVEAVKKALDDAGIEIPYPYRTLTFTKNEPDIINAVAGRSGNANDHADGHDS
ncbi:MAG: mechanosensitive ion channel family protein, partial [Planctomycetota bacterium]